MSRERAKGKGDVRKKKGKGKIETRPGLAQGEPVPKIAIVHFASVRRPTANRVGWPCFTTLLQAHAAQRGPKEEQRPGARGSAAPRQHVCGASRQDKTHTRVRLGLFLVVRLGACREEAW